MTHDDSQTRQAATQRGVSTDTGTATRRTFLKTTAVGAAGMATGGATVATAQEGHDGLNALSLDLSNLPDLGDDAYYEGWAIFPAPEDDEDATPEKVSTGVFSKGDEYVFGVDRDLAAATKVVVTIEPDDEAGGDPSGVVALVGELEDHEADLSFPVDFADASGSALLNTPTAPDADPQAGLWFLEPNPDGDGHVASLDLPELGDGWTYEGWGVTQGTPLTTGRFDDPTTADDSAPHSGEADAPPFPGEDFVQDLPEGVESPVDLADGDSMAVVSVEPDLDGDDPTGPGPFQVKPLAGEIPEGAEMGERFDLPRNDGTLPEGTASLHRNVDAARGHEDQQNAVAFDLSNLPDLGDDASYEGWAIYDGGDEKVSTGVFSKGQEYVFGVDRDLSAADAVAITIEPDDEAGGDPSGIVALHGEIDDGAAELSFPVDLSEASGSYLLNDPTSVPDADRTKGLWFLQPNPDGDGHVASLDLPELGDGWTYEGWGVTQGTPLTTGRFDDPTTADDSAPYSGPNGAPPFPGEDFLRNLPEGVESVDLADGDSKAVVSVEPDLDSDDPTGPGPFQIKPLVGEIPADAHVGENYDLEYNGGTTPAGTATLYDDVEAATGSDEDELNGLALDLSNLPELGDDAYYEGWAIYPPAEDEEPADAEKVSTGVFSKGDDYAFEIGRDLSAASEIAVTIEPDDEAGGDPSGIVALAGELEDGEADLSFPVDLSSASGSALLNTPTAPDADPQAGLWFLQPDPDGDGHVASLDLPELPGGWTYEGWGVTQGTPITTGRFDDPSMGDDAAPYSGEADAPPFPGEDFVQDLPEGVESPVDLADGSSKAVVSVEPDLDGDDPTGAAPFQIKPLVGEVPEGAEMGERFDLQYDDGTTPSGAATLHEDLDAAEEALGEDMRLELELSNLPELDDDAYYEGWAISQREDGAEKLSTGVFSAGEEYVFETDHDLTDADEVAITIEPDDEAGGDPSGVVVLHGELNAAGVAQLSFPASFDDAAGSFLLNTPTTGDLVSGKSGVWFLQPNPDGDGHVAALDLPELPGGWTYEGWVVHEETPITTGRFDDPAAADDGAPYSGTQGAPPFPGEDLVTNEPNDELLFPTDLTDGESEVVVSVEPDLDGEDPTGPAPFQVKPLVGEIPADAEVGTNYDLGRNEGTLPSGTASVATDATTATVGDQVVTDVDGDGNYRDVTGDGAVTMSDVTDFFGRQHRRAWNERVDLFDFDGDDRVGQSDVIALFEYVG